MIGVTHLFGCNENKPIDRAFSHRPRSPLLHILSLYPAYTETESGSGLSLCVPSCQPVTLRITLMGMTEMYPLLNTTKSASATPRSNRQTVL